MKRCREIGGKTRFFLLTQRRQSEATGKKDQSQLKQSGEDALKPDRRQIEEISKPKWSQIFCHGARLRSNTLSPEVIPCNSQSSKNSLQWQTRYNDGISCRSRKAFPCTKFKLAHKGTLNKVTGSSLPQWPHSISIISSSTTLFLVSKSTFNDVTNFDLKCRLKITYVFKNYCEGYLVYLHDVLHCTARFF